MGIKTRKIRPFVFDDNSVRPLKDARPAPCPCCGQLVMPRGQTRNTINFAEKEKSKQETSLRKLIQEAPNE